MSAQIQPRWLSVEDYPAGWLGSINEKSSSPTLGWTACKVICCWKQDQVGAASYWRENGHWR